MKATLIILIAAVVGVYGDASTCSAVNGLCDTNGKCEMECVTADSEIGTPTCDPVCSDGKKCSWKCETRVGAEVCGAIDGICETDGKCVTRCSTTKVLGVAAPTCTPGCSGGNKCSWQCEKRGDASTCSAVNGQCDTNGKCEMECVATGSQIGTPTCDPVCSGGKKCSWKCETRVGAEVCGAIDGICETDGKCVTRCSATQVLGVAEPTCTPDCSGGDKCSWQCEKREEPPKSGTSKPSIFLPLTILGILLRIHRISE